MGLIVIILIVILFCRCSSLSGYYQIDSTDYQTRTSKDEIKQFPDGSKVPEGYEYLITIEYKTGLITVECDYHHMVSEARKAVLKVGGDAFRLNNIKQPDQFTNTCYSGNVIIFKKNNELY
jgi:hypothetical protein